MECGYANTMKEKVTLLATYLSGLAYRHGTGVEFSLRSSGAIVTSQKQKKNAEQRAHLALPPKITLSGRRCALCNIQNDVENSVIRDNSTDEKDKEIKWFKNETNRDGKEKVIQEIKRSGR